MQRASDGLEIGAESPKSGESYRRIPRSQSSKAFRGAIQWAAGAQGLPS